MILVIIAIIIQIIIWFVTAIVITVSILFAIAMAIVCFIAGGILANLAVRALIGLWGDQQAEVTLNQARLGLVVLYATPAGFWLAAVEVVLLANLLGWRGNLYWGLGGLGLFFLSTPAYYGGWWAKEIPYLHLKLDLPFETDSTLRAEEVILVARLRAWALVARFRVRVFWRMFMLSARNR